MVIVQVEAVIHRDGWEGEVADVQDIGMLDDATYLCSGLREEGEGASIALALEPLVPVDASELVVRSQRMCQGRVSGTGTPAPLTVVVHQGEQRLLVETITPGGSWRDDRFGLSAPADGQTPLTVELLVPGGERQVAVSRLRIEAREVAAVVPAEVPAPHTQAPEIKDVPASPPAPGEVCVVVEPVDPGEVATAVEDGAACGLVPPVVEETAEEAPTQAPEVVKEPLAPPVVSKRKRARHGDGTYRGDNPATGDVNEAWVGES